MKKINNFLIRLNINKFQHALVLTGMFTAFFYIVFLITTAVSNVIPYHLVLYSNNINNIPFLDYFSIIYLTIGIYLFLGVFFLSSKEKINKYVFTLTVETIIAGCFFILMPLQSGYSVVQPSTDIFGLLYHVARVICIGHNYFPSLHIAFTTTAMLIFIYELKQFIAKFVLCLWWLLIVLSTLFIHVHYPVDILGGIILALICTKLIFFSKAKASISAKISGSTVSHN